MYLNDYSTYWVLQKGSEEVEGVDLHTDTNNFDYDRPSLTAGKKHEFHKNCLARF